MYGYPAVVYEGDPHEARERAEEYVRDALAMSLSHNPDISFIEAEQFTVDEARLLKERASTMPLGERQVFFIITHRILHEAQNALLKLFEEPAAHTHFILIVPSVEQLLPTVRSRLAYAGKHESDLRATKDADTFLKGTYPQRQRILAPIIKDKDRRAAHLLLNDLEAILHSRGTLAEQNRLREIAFVRQYMADRGSSLKALLEHVAVTI